MFQFSSGRCTPPIGKSLIIGSELHWMRQLNINKEIGTKRHCLPLHCALLFGLLQASICVCVCMINLWKFLFLLEALLICPPLSGEASNVIFCIILIIYIYLFILRLRDFSHVCTDPSSVLLRLITTAIVAEILTVGLYL